MPSGVAAIEISNDITVGELIVGVGTFALAWFTWRLARQAKKDVDLTQDSIEALDMPYVIASPQPGRGAIHFGSAPEDPIYLHFRLWNIGKGPAVVRDVQLRVGENAYLKAPDVHHAVAAGMAADTALPVTSEYASPEEPTAGVLTIYYSHASGEEYMTESPVDMRARRVYCRSYRRTPSEGGARDLADPPS